jgi:hypothetical protein
MLRSITRASSLAVLVIALSTGSAVAAKGGAGTETFTEHAHEIPLFSFPALNPCTGAAGTLSAIASNEVFHITTQADGQLWVTGTSEGAITFVPFEEGISYSGHFVDWFGEGLNQKNHVEHSTSTFVLSGTDGSRLVLHMASHLGSNANGAVTVEFERERSHAACG